MNRHLQIAETLAGNTITELRAIADKIGLTLPANACKGTLLLLVADGLVPYKRRSRTCASDTAKWNSARKAAATSTTTASTIEQKANEARTRIANKEAERAKKLLERREKTRAGIAKKESYREKKLREERLRKLSRRIGYTHCAIHEASSKLFCPSCGRPVDSQMLCEDGCRICA